MIVEGIKTLLSRQRKKDKEFYTDLYLAEIRVRALLNLLNKREKNSD
jgi:hypothetical protein